MPDVFAATLTAVVNGFAVHPADRPITEPEQGKPEEAKK